MRKAITSTAVPTYALKSEALAGMTASFRAILPCGGDRDAERNDGAGRRGDLRLAPCAGRRPAGASMGADEGQDRLSRRQGRCRASARSRPRRRGTHPAELEERGRGELARRMGDEPDADRRLHAQIRAVGAPARGRRAGPAGAPVCRNRRPRAASSRCLRRA